MIVTLTINPAIDRTILADRLVFEDRAYILSRSEAVGGRGINASQVIHSFGAATSAIAACGGKQGKHFEELLATSGFPVEIVRVKSEMRANLTISDKQGLAIKLNERGAPLSEGELERIVKAVKSKLVNAKWLMICGSVPPGVKPTFYSQIIEIAKKMGVKTLLDTDGDSLLHGIEAGPTAVAPNQLEAERLLNRVLITRQHFLDAAERIVSMGAESVILSLGSRGAVGQKGGQVIEAIPPRVDALSPIGAGDALAAAFTWALAEGKTFPEAIHWGVAAGTAAACLPGVQFPTFAQTEEIYQRVELRGNL